MVYNKSYKIYLWLYILLYIIVSKMLFINIYDTVGYVIDELFHIPQGIQYCQMNFSAWDPKITTLPGLYLVSAVLMGPFELCTVYWLRFTNLIASVVNLYLFCILCNAEENSPNPKKPLSLFALLSGINLAILPPLYFFSHVYYTDTLSITFVLLTVILAKYNRHVLAALTGAFSIIMRQTNIIWVAMVFGQNVLDIFIQITSSKRQRSKRKHVNGSDLYNSVRTVLQNGFPFSKMTGEYYTLIFSYTNVILAFLLFVYVNGSIVVGDKSAHEATIHVPQLFYFSLFCAFFTLPHICQDIIPFMKFVWNKKVICTGLLIICALFVRYNTLIHPYLLADNRHYTFYIWNRVYAKYSLTRYLLIGSYIFAMYAILRKVDLTKNFAFLLVAIPCIVIVLILQKLIDVRYFLIPFILLRSKFHTRNPAILIIEHLFYLFINYLTFYIFFTKEIFWTDFNESQRLIW